MRDIRITLFCGFAVLVTAGLVLVSAAKVYPHSLHRWQDCSNEQGHQWEAERCYVDGACPPWVSADALEGGR